jgi:hypothetical protein
MKYIFFILFITSVYAETSKYALIDADGTVIEIMVSDPETANKYPAAASQYFPTAVKCIQSDNAGMGWHYDSVNNVFIPPFPEVTINTAQSTSSFTLQDPTLVTTTNNASVINLNVTTNNVAVTTNNVAVTTNNVTQ